MSGYINPPLCFIGNKFKLLDQLLPKFDYTKKTFVDLFVGGGSVYTNVLDKYDHIIINDIIKELVEIHKSLLFDLENFTNNVKNIIPIRTHKEQYLKLRESYNFEKTPEKLYALILSCSRSIMRYNMKFEFNQTYGNGIWGKTMDNRVLEFYNHLLPYKDKIQYNYQSFENVSIPDDSMIYLDPPYINTFTGYNRYWKKHNEERLYQFILDMNNRGNSFVLSGVLTYNGLESELLKKLISDGFIHEEIRSDYNRGISKITVEIIIKNFS